MVPAPVHADHAVVELRHGLFVEAFGGNGGCILHGSPAALSRICARFGFKNACTGGRVYLTAAKTERLPLVLSEVQS